MDGGGVHSHTDTYIYDNILNTHKDVWKIGVMQAML